jgi:hypothetical protein
MRGRACAFGRQHFGNVKNNDRVAAAQVTSKLNLHRNLFVQQR